MELRQLRYFKVVADARSFARGSQDLRVAQPALSRSIAKLEEEIGRQLFIRHSAGVSLTDAGTRFYAHATQVLGSVRELLEGMAEEDNEPQGTVMLGAPQSIQAKLALPVAGTFLSRYARCRLDLVQDSSARLRDKVLEGSLDLAILSNVAGATGINLTPLVKESICVVCRPEDRKLFGEIVEIRDLLKLPLIVSGYPQSLRLYIDRKFPRLADAMIIRSEVNSSAMVSDLVARGVGFGIAPHCVKGQATEPRLAFVPIEGLDTAWAIATNCDRQGMRAIKELEALLSEAARALIEGGDWPTAWMAA